MTKWLLLAPAALGLLGFGCACGGPGTGTNGDDDIGDDDVGDCSDLDGDGYGVGAGCEGTDCNDSVPDIHTQEQCDQFCDDHGDLGPGCPCDAVEPEICYFGPAETLGIGACRAGLMVCDGGVWGECEGQQLPDEEVCDDADNNCDGATDEGVLSPCGNCNFDCEEDCVGVGCDEAYDTESNGNGVVLTPEGGLTLGGESVVRNHVIWIANSSQGTVTKINTRTREEEGRYATGPGAGGWLSPSRTTVNLYGDVVVANRGAAGEATRYNASDCPDQDGDGDVETSTGMDDVYPWMEDECWIWSTPVGSGARGSGFEYRVGLDGVVEEYVWVGDYGHMDVHEINAEDGEMTGRTIPGVNPYGLAMGPNNALWTFSNGASALLTVDTTDDDLEATIIPLPAGESWYGITVDNVGRVWIGSSIARYDPEADEWESPAAGPTGGGIACDSDGNAFIGEAGGGWGAGGPWKIDAETLEFEQVGDGTGGGHGWAVDFDGYIWSVEFGGSRAWAYDPDTLEIDFTYNQLVGAYTYSDMTGFQLVNATNPAGTYTHVFEGCDDGTIWAELRWEAVTPPGTTVSFAVRTANDLPGLSAAAAIPAAAQPPDEGPVNLTDLFADNGIPEPHGNMLQVDVTLTAVGADDPPVLNNFSATHSCEIGID
jgi:hypothetical protein